MAERELEKAYRPSAVEGAVYERWLAADVFAPDGAGSRADASKPPFVIIQPPPNVTGSLHLGHAQRTAVEDLMIRHARMQGRPALFLPGLDHASIAAQVVLDGILAREGETRASLGRDRYLERMHEFVERTRGVILGQQRRVGASADWGRLRFTMDEGSARAVRHAFAALYRDGLAYRTEALINWCPTCRTSLSDLEVIATPTTGTIWSVRYHLIDESTGAPDPDSWISVATTRPETILGDTGVAVHPDDVRYAALVGREVRIPFVERDVPIVADESVDRAFGSGAVKVTPAHDATDLETGRRHGLASIDVMADDGTINERGGAYAGLDRFAARTRILDDLVAQGDFADARPHEMVLGRCQRSDDIVEPRLKTQWFIRTAPLAERALEVTRSGRTTILPERFEKVWEHWLTGIRDWNVSRQLWWGHRIPAWYCPDGHITVTELEEGPAACGSCGCDPSQLRQDPDIFDTWFSSGLWPFSTLGWPDATDDLARYYPGSVMETGYDIIFFWVARMVMLGLALLDEAPFATVYLSGLIRDPYGRKMSKTTGNVVDPLEIIDSMGADALRFALIHGATPGLDQKFGAARVENARNFVNKLWNATRYVLGARPVSIPPGTSRQAPNPAHLGPGELWIRSRRAATIDAVDGAMAEFQFAEVTRSLYEAIWSEFCDWGIELSKVRLSDVDLPGPEREATWWTLVETLDTYLRLLHPVMPFVTEELWGSLPHESDDPSLLMVATWPRSDAGDPAAMDAGGIDSDAIDAAAVEAGASDSDAGDPAAMDAGGIGSGAIDAAAVEAGASDVESERASAMVGPLIDFVRAARNARAEGGLEASAWLGLRVVVPAHLSEAFEGLRPAIARLARARPLEVVGSRAELAESDAPGTIAVISGDIEARIIPSANQAAAGDRDRERLEKELAEAEGFLAGANGRLANTQFMTKAPPEVVAGALARAEELAELVRRLRAHLEA
ncbi:MAG: valine--tRNA ligase [Chloroflexi bacterium]|nr:valine--tRNA ligase [Chloroflexota bacterium]